VSQTSFHKIIFRNSIVNTLRYIINYSIIFVLTPIIINGIGDAQYGLWALIFSLIGYAGLLDLGVQQATIKLVSEYKGKNDLEKLNEIISSTVFYFFYIGLFVTLICWFVLPHMMHHFVDDNKLLSMTGMLLFIVGVDVVFVFLGNVFTGISLGLHQYHLKGIIDVCCGLSRLVATIYVLNNGYGLIGLAWIALVLDFVATVFLYLVCIYSNPQISVSFRHVKRSAFKEIFSFGGKVFMASTAMRINSHTTVVLIAYYLSTTMTAYYNVVSRLVGSVQEVLWSLTASLFPVFSELSSSGDKRVVWKYYAQYTRYFLLLTAPAALGLFYFGTPFISLWISEDYAGNTRVVMMLLSIGALVAGFQPLAARVMIGGGNVSFYTKVTVIKSLGVLVLSVPMIFIFGLPGPPLAMLIGEFFYQVAVFYYLSKYFEVKTIIYMKICFIPVIVPLVSSFIFFQIINLFFKQGYILFSGFLFIVLMFFYFFICFFFALNNEEKSLIMKWRTLNVKI
jgi:O-antigen/teichoic acid export membrane protein